MTSSTAGAVLAAAVATSIISSLSTSLSETSTFVALSTNSTARPEPGAPPVDGGNCHLLGPFAILVQGALGALALLSLVYKRWRERPQRPVKIWAFDASKQVFGTVLLHMANLVMSMFSAGEIEASIARAAAKSVGAGSDDEWRPNPCSFYLLNLAIDTTLGIPILLLILKVLTVGASHTAFANPPESIKSGNYGDPPRASWWLKQSFIYFLGLLGMKTVVFFIFQLCPWIVIVGDWALKWTEGNTALQIAFVMLIFPLIMNAFQYYVIDSFIKKNPQSDDDGSPTSHEDSEGERGGLLADADDHGHGNSIDEDSAYKTVARPTPTEVSDREATNGSESASSRTVTEHEGSSSPTPKNVK